MDARLRDRLSALALLARSSLAVFGRVGWLVDWSSGGRVGQAGRQAERERGRRRRAEEGGSVVG